MTAYIPISATEFAIVDLDDVPALFGASRYWALEPGRYPRATLQQDGTRKTVRLHRFLLGFPSQLIDHLNGDKLDNRRANLRVCTKSQNVANTPSVKNRWKGIHYHKRDKVWIAQIMVNKKRTQIGTFLSEEDAATAYNFAAAQLHGEFAFYNTTEQPWLEGKE